VIAQSALHVYYSAAVLMPNCPLWTQGSIQDQDKSLPPVYLRSPRPLRWGGEDALLDNPPDEVRCIALSDDGLYVAAVLSTSTLTLWDLFAKTIIAQSDKLPDILSLEFLAQPPALLCRESHRTVLRDVSSFAIIRVLITHSIATTAMTVSAYNTHVAIGEEDGAIQLLRLDSASPLRVLNRHHLEILCLCFSADVRLLASVCGSNMICVWDVSSQTLLHHRVEDQIYYWIDDISFHPQRNALLYTYQEVFETSDEASEESGDASDDSDEDTEAIFVSDDTEETTCVFLWEFTTDNLPSEVYRSSEDTNHLCGSYLSMTSSHECDTYYVSLVDLVNVNTEHDLLVSGPVSVVKFSLDGKRLVCVCSSSNTIHVFHIAPYWDQNWEGLDDPAHELAHAVLSFSGYFLAYVIDQTSGKSIVHVQSVKVPPRRWCFVPGSGYWITTAVSSTCTSPRVLLMNRRSSTLEIWGVETMQAPLQRITLEDDSEYQYSSISDDAHLTFVVTKGMAGGQTVAIYTIDGQLSATVECGLCEAVHFRGSMLVYMSKLSSSIVWRDLADDPSQENILDVELNDANLLYLSSHADLLAICSVEYTARDIWSYSTHTWRLTKHAPGFIMSQTLVPAGELRCIDFLRDDCSLFVETSTGVQIIGGVDPSREAIEGGWSHPVVLVDEDGWIKARRPGGPLRRLCWIPRHWRMNRGGGKHIWIQGTTVMFYNQSDEMYPSLVLDTAPAIAAIARIHP
jgi:WD40 repeat protein